MSTGIPESGTDRMEAVTAKAGFGLWSGWASIVAQGSIGSGSLGSGGSGSLGSGGSGSLSSGGSGSLSSGGSGLG